MPLKALKQVIVGIVLKARSIMRLDVVLAVFTLFGGPKLVIGQVIEELVFERIIDDAKLLVSLLVLHGPEF